MGAHTQRIPPCVRTQDRLPEKGNLVLIIPSQRESRTVSKVGGSWLSIGSFKQHTFTEKLSLQAANTNLMKSMRLLFLAISR